MIYEKGVQYCENCKKDTLHNPKMDAVKNGQRVCSECSCCNYYIEDDKLKVFGMCIHGNNMASCQECATHFLPEQIELDPEIAKVMDEFAKIAGKKKPKLKRL